MVLLAVVLGAGSITLGQATTMPAEIAPTKMLVIPFAQIGNTSGHEWVGAAIHESLMNEAEGNIEVQPVALDHPLARGDMPQVTAAAKGTGAALVVFGAYQYSDSQLRVTGEIVDVNYGRVLGTLKATGPLTDLFKIEDSLASQMETALPQPPASAPVVANATDQSAAPVYTGNQAAAAAPPMTTYVYGSPYGSAPVDNSPNYVYTYPDYGYGYPYYYGGFPVIVGGGWGWGGHSYSHGYVGFHGGFSGGGFHGGGFHGGGGHGR